MKKQILISLVLLGSVLTMNAQTLYIPNGTGGIGNNTNNSNVGIGVINPQSALEVNGDITLDFKTIYFDRSSNKDHYKISNTSWDDGLRYYHYTAHKFYTQGIERLRIIGNGNVGIGTETPTYKLDVCGTIRAKEIKVDLLGGCDFVFKKDYKLMSLNELDKFVTTKQHLPEIASEKEMIEDGVNMKEFQMKLLQKIEELTLYTIQQNRKIETLDQEFKKLKAENKKLKSTKK